jgi:hypothetical protein
MGPACQAEITEAVRGFFLLATESGTHRGGVGEQGGDGERRRGSRGHRRGSRKVEEALLRLLGRTARRGRLEVAGDERRRGVLAAERGLLGHFP